MNTEDERRLSEIKSRLAKTGEHQWRNTIRRESGSEVSEAIQTAARLGTPRCSQAVVNCDEQPTAENVICWMGPASGSCGDDLFDASFIANAKADIAWLLEKLDRAT